MSGPKLLKRIPFLSSLSPAHLREVYRLAREIDVPAGQPANLVRAVVEGSTNTPHEYLRLHVDPGNPGQPFSCENVEFVTGNETPCPAPLAPAPA